MARTKEFNKAEILEKAKQLFWKQGFHATSIQNLVDHLGINRASIYDTFGGKNELYEAAFLAYREENLTFMQQRLSKFDSVKKALKSLFREIIKIAIDDKDRKGCFVINCTTEYLPKHESILVELVSNKGAFQEIISKSLQEGKSKGEIDSKLNIKDTSAYLFSLLSGLQISAKVKSNKTELFKSIDMGMKVLDLEQH